MGRPAGMGVRFLQLDPRSRRVLRRLVEDHFAHFGGPVESEGPSGPAGDSSAEPGRVPLVSQWDSHTDWAEFKQRKKRNRAFGWAALILAGLALVVAFSPWLINLLRNREDSAIEISPKTLGRDAAQNEAVRAEPLVEAANRTEATRSSPTGDEQVADSMNSEVTQTRDSEGIPLSEATAGAPVELARQVVDCWSTAWSN